MAIQKLKHPPEEGLSGRAFKEIAFRELARMGGALSDPRRLELLDLICQSEKAVEQAACASRLSMAAASHHLRTLRLDGLALSRKEGRNVYYRASPAGRRIWLAMTSLGEEYASAIREAMRSFFQAESELTTLPASALLEKVRKNKITLIDVRPAEEYGASHLPGSISVPLADLERVLEKIPRTKPVAAYCRGRLCVMSREAVALLRSKGYDAHRLKFSPLDLANQDEYA